MTESQAHQIADAINDSVEGLKARVVRRGQRFAVADRDSDGSVREFSTYEPVAGWLGLTVA